MAQNSAAADGGYILFFTPESGVVPHFTAQAVMAKVLKERGHRVLMVRCQSVFTRCPVMDMYLLPHSDVEANKKQVCTQCQHVAKTFIDSYGLDFVSLPDLLTPDITARVKHAVDNAPMDFREFVFEGISFGKMCMMAVVHATKTSEFDNVNPEIREAWKQYIITAITSYLLVGKLCQQLPIKSIVHHEDYNLLVAARLAGQALNIPTVTMSIGQHMGGDRRRYQFFHIPAWGQAFLTLQMWAQFRELSIAPSQIKDAIDDVLLRFGAPNAHVYSPQKTFIQGDFRDEMKIPKNKKLLVLYTSSLDELIASSSQQEAINLPRIRMPQTFKNQIEWIQAVIDFVKKETEFYLIVRIHPREGVNKREGISSQHLVQLKHAFEGKEFANCSIVWPEMPLSSYDMAEIADLVLVSWSTLGLELSRLAVPILASTYGNAPRPWDDFHEWGITPAHYFNKLKELIKRPPNMDAAKHAFRFYILHYFGYTIDVSDIIPTRDFHGLPNYREPASASQLERTLVHGEEVLTEYKTRLLANQSESNIDAEDKEIKKQMRRAVHFLLTKEERTEDFTLIVALNEKFKNELSKEDLKKIETGHAAFLLSTPTGVEYYFGKHISRRYSPMVLRLATLSCDRVLGQTDKNTKTDLGLMSFQKTQEESWIPAGKNILDTQLAEAGRLRDEGLLDQARMFALENTKKNGESAEWENFLGHLECLEGNIAKAKLTFLNVVKRWPKYGKSHNNLAAIYWDEGDKPNSLEQMAIALELEPDQWDIVYNGVRILVAMGMDEDARSLCDSYMKKNPKNRNEAERLILMLANT